MGALREKMIEEMKLRNFAARTQKSYVAAMVGLARHYRRFPDQLTQEEIRTYLLQLQERGLSASSQNVNFGAAVFLSAGFGLDPRTVLFAAEKTDVAVARSVKPQRSRAIALSRGQIQRSLFIDDRVLGGAASH